jgi:Flp pilus assembly protein TadB
MKGPPITVTCHCGEIERVPYGQTWTCETCGRRWNTTQIPKDVYWGIMREMRRYRLVVIAVALAITAVLGVLALFVSEGIVLLFPVLLAFWFIWFMPWWRRRIRKRARSLPSWQLTPEEPSGSV